MEIRLEQNVVREVVFGDVHAPHHHGPSFDRLIAVIREVKPHVIRDLGDHRDLSWATNHYTEDSYSAEEECDAVADNVTRIKDAATRRCILVHHQGNHGKRAQKHVPARMRSMLDWRAHDGLREAWDHWVHVPYINDERGICRINRVASLHGFGGPEDHQAIRVWNMLGHPGGEPLVVSGHNHAPRNATRVMRTGRIPLPYWHANPGTLGPLKPTYAEEWDTGLWGRGILVLEHTLDRWDCRLIRL